MNKVHILTLAGLAAIGAGVLSLDMREHSESTWRLVYEHHGQLDIADTGLTRSDCADEAEAAGALIGEPYNLGASVTCERESGQ